MSGVMGVFGVGKLAERVIADLSKENTLVHQADLSDEIPEGLQFALVVHDQWQPAVHIQAEKVFRLRGVPWLRGFVSFGQGVIGPLVQPHSAGCSQCADLRTLMAGNDRREMWGIRQRLIEHGSPLRGDIWSTASGFSYMATMLVKETRHMINGQDVLTQGHLFFIHLKTLDTSQHVVLPDGKCPFCGELPDDSPFTAQITLKPSPKISLSTFRTRSMTELKQVLPSNYLDSRTGLFNGKAQDFDTTFADVTVNLPLFIGDEATAGRTHSYEESEMTAILEGLERHCGYAPQGRRPTVRDTYRNRENEALYPPQVGLHRAEQYANEKFPFKPFNPDRDMDWVWGWSLNEERPLLVPQLLAYYSFSCSGGYVYETSNGCAMGGSLEEAIFHGIMEVVERDAFLLTWYAQLPLPRLEPTSAKDQELHWMIDRMRAVAGYEVHLFNATMENGIPAVWAIAKNQRSQGVNLICAAGAHLDPIRAVKSSIYELAGILPMLDQEFTTNKEKAISMLKDPMKVREMKDHSLLYSLSEAEERLGFLLEGERPKQSFEEAFPQVSVSTDITEDLKGVLARFQERNLEVIVVNQTSPEVARHDLHCVKVLIPGMLPMTFGHHFTRLEGLKRVLHVPKELGYLSQSLTMDQLNPHPHPFP
ncbi:ribosomal protein S12 methylthiotransferase accessory factor [Marininema mesophilum]|uniref:Ribosomal protein S12 methylthiotransferase accessory factor n=1 Tax=Marininema mesophilum TaxID=1048340 RepID=A0A1H2PYU4_9BACL|nr:TOMM precursor leader peptide-binding protein [Marininema mesophilum]SDW00012.1 ribosomal protein S12 methylthiotransferase accessory factor [Marininema mesophilum]